MCAERTDCGQHGAWPSPISPELVASAGTGSAALPREIRADGNDIYWIEFHPGEESRYLIMRREASGEIERITPPGFNVRSRVHEYGGGAYAVHNSRLFFVNDANQAIYSQDAGSEPILLTQPAVDHRVRYADLTVSPGGDWLLAVRERHLPDGQVINDLSAIPLKGEWKVIQLTQGHDFYAAPRFKPSGDAICWLQWDHPNMPWDGTELQTANFTQGVLFNETHVAGGPDESIYQPDWSLDGVLHFVSDRSGWWNLYRFQGGKISPLYPMHADFGRPAWLFGFSSYAFLSEHNIAAVYKLEGKANLGLIDIPADEFQPVPTGYTSFELPSIAADSEGKIWFLAGNPTQSPGLVQFDPSTDAVELIQPIGINPPVLSYISTPGHLSFHSAHGRQAYAYFYPPRNPGCPSSETMLPPLIVTAHGGPTSCARPHLDIEIQFWTTRGFAVLDVDYTGSSGYGRAYRRALDGQWGLADVEDCIFGARFLVQQGLVAEQKLLIRGRSAGGLLVLAALTFFDTFQAGASYYGIGNLETLADHTHKFEAHYLDRLVGPLPQAQSVYRARSPLAHIDQLMKPVILFQGLDDAVVPPALVEEISAALQAKGLPYACLTFPGEGHGFHRPETIIRAFEAELEFYQRILGIADENSPPSIEIRNL
jgi:dipeptidyl aminopeptidase/acylaminoacyl peptidase